MIEHDGAPLPEGGRRRSRRPLPARTSAVLREIAYADGERVAIGEVLQGLRHRAFGLTMLLFALPNCLPMPPGIPTISGVALVVIAANLLLGRRRLWVPKTLTARTIERAHVRRMVDRSLPYLQRLERVCQPRLAVVTETAGKVVVGLVVLALGVLMILPIPLVGNIPPGIAVTIIAIGLAERDGVVVIGGGLVGLLAMAIAGAAAWAAILGIVEIVSGS